MVRDRVVQRLKIQAQWTKRLKEKTVVFNSLNPNSPVIFVLAPFIDSHLGY